MEWPDKLSTIVGMSNLWPWNYITDGNLRAVHGTNNLGLQADLQCESWEPKSITRSYWQGESGEMYFVIVNTERKWVCHTMIRYVMCAGHNLPQCVCVCVCTYMYVSTCTCVRVVDWQLEMIKSSTIFATPDLPLVTTCSNHLTDLCIAAWDGPGVVDNFVIILLLSCLCY